MNANNVIHDTKPLFRRLFPWEVSAVGLLLKENELTTDDWFRQDIQKYGLFAENELVASGALEHYSGGDSLLRSVVVKEKYRGGGAGRRLVAMLERTARYRGTQSIWMLTLTAEDWFARLGYQSVKRKNAPAAIRHSREFASLCPATACLMMKSLK